MNGNYHQQHLEDSLMNTVLDDFDTSIKANSIF